MRVTATAKYVRISPRKVRLVTDLITGKPVEEAAAILRFLPNACRAGRGEGAEERDRQRGEQLQPLGRRARPW